MAEVFGVAAGALGVAALFNNCVQSFEYLQLGRSFGRDYQTCQLRLDAARLRLSRWGEAVSVYHKERFTCVSADDDREALMAVSYFEEIQHLIHGVQKSAKRYQITDPSRDISLASTKEMTAVGIRVHNRAAAIARYRQRSASALKKATWALYDGKELGKLISQIMTLLDELEKIFPIELASRSLVEFEIEEILEDKDDVPGLAALREAAEGTDTRLAEAIEKKMLLISGSNSAGDVQTTDLADVQVGHRYADHVMAQGLHVTDNTRNSAGGINASGSSKVQIGNRFGSS